MRTESVSQLLDAAMAQVRIEPTNASARMKLFRVFAATGQWQRAATQLDTASTLDPELGFTAMVYRQALGCERFREEVFAGRRTPMIVGEPAPWLARMVEALRAGPGPAQRLRSEAFEEAPASRGRLNGGEFEWVADADARMGPLVECFIDGKYYWAPFERIERLELREPDDLLDLVWASSEIRFSAGGSKHVLLPVRYAGTETREDDELRLSRKTIWEGDDDSGYRGIGQRIWSTDRDEVGLLDVRLLEVGPSAP